MGGGKNEMCDNADTNCSAVGLSDEKAESEIVVKSVAYSEVTGAIPYWTGVWATLQKAKKPGAGAGLAGGNRLSTYGRS